MQEMARLVGLQSGLFEYAEGWRRHLHLGFCTAEADPLTHALSNLVVVSADYESSLEQRV